MVPVENPALFIASRDLMDTLKTEASILTPEQDIQIKQVADSIKQTFTKMYRPYIPTNTLARIRHLEDRVVVMDSETYEQMVIEWISTTRGTHTKSLGITLTNGGIIAINDPQKAWNNFTPEDQEILIQQHGSLTAASSFVANLALGGTLTHELIHQFQENYNPVAFLECAVRYYQSELAMNLGFGHCETELDDDRRNYFSSLVEEYGDDAHKVFFGSPLSISRRHEISHKMSNEIESKLFPEGC